MKKIILVLVLAALAVVFTACPNPTAIELRYDDGEPDGKQGVGGPGYGFLVEFLPPSAPSSINKVRISGELVGSGYENRTFDVLIWDKARNELYKASFPHTKFPSSGWAEIDIPKVVVNDNFSVVVITNTPRDSGVYLHYDSSVKNEHSDLVQDWEAKGWYLGVPKEKTNWMIRVVIEK